VFSAKVSQISVRQTLNNYLGNQRSGTAKTKTRSEVSGGGAKPFRQKGTGRARAGSNRSPLWQGGGTTFGPIPRSYRSKVNKKVRRGAIRSVLTQRLAEGAVTVIDSIDFPEIKTRQVVELVERLGLKGSVLIVSDKVNLNLALSARNLQRTDVVVAENLNIHNLLGHPNLILTKAAAERLTEIHG